MIKIKCFGIAKEIVGQDLASIAERSMTVAELRRMLSTSYPELDTIASYMVAVNQCYATDEVVINSTDEVAIIPPVSGG